MASFPEDLLLKLLALLPIHSVLRFKCVSKEWYRLIETPYFRRLHHEKQRELIKRETSSPGIITLRNYKLCVVNKKDFNYQEIPNVPFKNTKIKEFHSCNGVLCLHCGYRKVVIWNPLSDKYQELHTPAPQPGSKFAFGFGYDRVLDDYKLVAVEKPGDNLEDNIVRSAMVYSVKSDRWKRIDGFNYRLQNLDAGVLVGDSVHWLTKNKCILAFNLTTDQFHEIPLPKFCCSRLLTDVCINIGVFSSCLSITCIDDNCQETLYVMEIYEANDSWVMVELDFDKLCSSNMKPVANLENGKVLMFRGISSSLLYDTKTKSVKHILCGREAHPYEATFGFYGGKPDDVGKRDRKAKRVSKALPNKTRNKRARF